MNYDQQNKFCHNPYFNRWFSAIKQHMTLHVEACHNPYFNRWFSAINDTPKVCGKGFSHNPYFNRWFSAIASHHSNTRFWEKSHNPYFNRWFSAIRFFI